MNTLVFANLSCLLQGIHFLQELPQSIYTHKCAEVFGSSIGGHIRHNLDHYNSFLDGLESGKIDYDDRKREETVESQKEAAILVMKRIHAGMETLAEADLDRPLEIRMDDGGDSSWSRTSIRRELQFLLSHTIHHYALIVSIAGREGVTSYPPGFGIAPSTLNYQAAQGS